MTEEIKKVPSVRIERVAPSVYSTFDPLKAYHGGTVADYAANEHVAGRFELEAGKWVAEIQGRILKEDGSWERTGSPIVADKTAILKEGDVLIFRDKPKTDG